MFDPNYVTYDPSWGNRAIQLNQLNSSEGNSLATNTGNTRQQHLIGTVGNPWGTAQQNIQLSKEHYGEPNDKGLVPINDSGFKHLNDNIPARSTIADNSSLIHIAPQSGIPDASVAPIMQANKGLIGRAFDTYVGTVIGGIIGKGISKMNTQQTPQTRQLPASSKTDELDKINDPYNLYS